MSRITFLATLISLLVSGCANGAGPPSSVSSAQLPALRREMAAVDSELVEAETASDRLTGGLIKVLIEQRIEILKLSRALVSQRIIAIETRAPMTTRLSVTRPDSARVVKLDSELAAIRKQLKEMESESAQYEGGLVKATIDMNVATLRVTLSTLQTERLKALYGIHWPSGDSAVAPATVPIPSSRPTAAASARAKGEDKALGVLVPSLRNKRFQESDYQSRIYEDAIWFDVEWSAEGLRKPTRAIKGTLIIADLFGEPKLKIQWTINRPLSPGDHFEEKGVGFEYNQFKNEHQWMHSTDLADMTFRFRVESIIYQDGAREEF